MHIDLKIYILLKNIFKDIILKLFNQLLKTVKSYWLNNF